MNITAIIINFHREEYLFNCIESLQKHYPNINIMVGDNEGENKERRKKLEDIGVEYHAMPYDAGICYARNKLVENVKTDYLLIGDDDFQYDKISKIDKMAKFLDNNEAYDLIGGRVFENNILRNYQGHILEKKDGFEYKELELNNFDKCRKSRLEYKACDLTFNFFVARTKSIKKVKWNENIKVRYEHSTYFIDFKRAGFNVCFSPDPIVLHKPDNIKIKSTEYPKYRNRSSDKDEFFRYFDKKYVIGFNGKKDVCENGDIDDIDFLITHFIRKDKLEKLLLSIAKYYPEARISIADQCEKIDKEWYLKIYKKLSKEGLINKPTAYQLESDCGLSFSRNFLVIKTKKPYKLILEDDFVFTGNTKIEYLKKVLTLRENIGIVGGNVINDINKADINFDFDIVRKPNAIVLQKSNKPYRKLDNIEFAERECIPNFFLARRQCLITCKWDEVLKSAEHLDFFTRFKETNYKVYYIKDVSVLHFKSERNSDNYMRFRRRKDFIIKMMQKQGIEEIRYANGLIYKLSNLLK